VFNEKVKILRSVNRFKESGILREADLIVMNDGSTDCSVESLERQGVRVLSHSAQKGVGAAIRTVIEYARAQGYDILVITAGNDKDDPAEIPRLLEPIIRDNYDFVQGSRYLAGGRYGNMPAYRRFATQFLHPKLFSLITGRTVTDSTNGFRAFKLSLFQDVRIHLKQQWLDQYELEPYLYYKVIKLGYKVKEVPVSKIYPPHEEGYSKMKPVLGWWSILRPVVMLGLGIKK